MKRDSLHVLACPCAGAKGPCRSPLTVEEKDGSPLVEAADPRHGIIEGVLRCSGCGATFPIVCGLPILIPELKDYLRANYALLISMAAQIGEPLSDKMLRYLEQQGAHCPPVMSGLGWHYGSPHQLSVYLSAHYDDVLYTLPEGNPLRALLQAARVTDPYSTLVGLVAPHIEGLAEARAAAPGEARPVALDVGCHVGRLARELAPRCGTVLGLDMNFAAALTARRILVGWPRPFDGYDLYREGLLNERRAIALPPFANTEVIVGSGLSLPLRDGAIDVAVSTNVLDAIPAPALLLQEMGRSLRAGGVIGNACIYMWDIVVPTEGWLGGKDAQESAERVRRFLCESFDLIGEADYVPWVLHQYDRSWGLHLSHCIAGRKRAASDPRTPAR
ncbi:MAG: methyltransferase domain-containing protein [Polyangia bacterium]